MRAAVLESWQTPLVLTDVELAEPRAGEVRVRVHHCGVCHSDLSVVDGHLPAPTPVVLGHEASGVVDAVGDGVTLLSPGDHVVLTPSPPCGHCYWCVRGEWSVCQNSVALMTGTLPDGTTPLQRDGSPVFRGLGVAAFAEHVITPATGAVRIPDDVPLELACVLGCAVQTGVGAVLNTARVPEGATVVVLGLGGVGLAVVQGARLAGASRIVASDPVPDRRHVALGLGATDVIDPTDTDVSSAVHDLTGGVGADYAFDAVGRAALVNTGIDAVRMGGTVVMVGMPALDDPLTLSSATIFAATEKKLLGCLLGSVNSRREIPRLVDLWRVGRLDLEPLVTSRRPLGEVNEALEDLRAARGIRTVLDVV